MDKELLWKNIYSGLELELGKNTTRLCFGGAQIQELGNGVCVLGVVNNAILVKVQNKYSQNIDSFLARFTGEKLRVRFVVLPKKETEKPLGPLFVEEEKTRESSFFLLQKKYHLRPEYTFSNYVVSSTNNLAFAAAQAVAKNPGTSYNPLFIYGGVGVGKTHLMQAVAQALLIKNPGLSVAYLSGEEFMNEIVEAIQNKNTTAFKKKYRSLGLLLLDDVQFFGGKDTAQEEFFHTFNSLVKEDSQIIMTSDKKPQEIIGLEDRLRSRFEEGMVVDIQEPDMETRAAILLAKAKQKGITITTPLAVKIAAKISSTRQIEGFLKSLQNRAEGTAIDEEQINIILTKMQGSGFASPPQKISDQKIIDSVSLYYHIKASELRGQSRRADLVVARQVCMYLLRSCGGLGLVACGAVLGNRDHTTIIHGERKIKELLTKGDNVVKNDVEKIFKMLTG